MKPKTELAVRTLPGYAGVAAGYFAMAVLFVGCILLTLFVVVHTIGAILPAIDFDFGAWLEAYGLAAGIVLLVACLVSAVIGVAVWYRGDANQNRIKELRAVVEDSKGGKRP